MHINFDVTPHYVKFKSNSIDCSIKSLTKMISKVVGFDGKVIWDTFKPDGTPIKLMDSSKLTKLGWSSSIPLEAGLKSTYKNFLSMKK